MTSKIVAENVTKVFGDEPERALNMLSDGYTKEQILSETGQTVGVQDVSFTVEEGEIFVVMGLSGSGKSTLVRMLNRLIDATAGSVTIEGDDILAVDAQKLREIRLRKMAMVFQHFALFPHRTVLENVEYGLKVQGVPASERHEKGMAALRQVGLDAWADRRPDALSGGMQQRVGLARGLAVAPEILLMDEPFSALDPLIRRDMQNELLELQREMKKTIVFITHDLLEALILGDRIAIMKEGRFVQVGTAEEIVGHPADDYVAEFTKDIDRSRVFSADRAVEPANALDLSSDTRDSALEAMGRTGRDALHVTENGRLAGLVRWRDLSAQGAETALSAHLIRDVPTTAPETHLYRLFSVCARGLPVAVCDSGGALIGALRPETVLAELSAEDDGAPRAAKAAAAAA